MQPRPFFANLTAADESVLAALRVSESRYRRLFETAQDGILLLNSDTAQIEDVNPYLVKMLGYTHAEFLGKKLWEVGAFAHIAQCKEMFLELQDSGFIRYEDLPLKTSAGLRIEVEFVSNSYDCAGIKVIQCNIRDISVRKKIEKALSDSELRTRRLLSAVNVGLWDWDLQTEEVYLSPEWKHQLGCTDADLPNSLDTWRDRLHPDDLADTIAAVNDFRNGRSNGYDMEFRLRHKDGSWRWIISHADISRDAAGVPLRMMGSHIDITPRHEARNELREAAARQAAIIDASMDAIIAVGDDERILIFSAAAERMFKVTAAQVIGGPLEQFIPLRYRANHCAQRKLFGQTGTSTRAMGQYAHLTALRHDGVEFPIEASISHITLGEGQLYTVTIRDITDREFAATARNLLEEQLRESQKMEAIGTLAGGIAHDFNNIIATIMGNAELAREDAAAAPKILESIEEIRKAGVRARDLVQQILSFSRRQSTERRMIALDSVVTEAVRLLRAVLPARIALDVRCAADVPLVLADAVQIQQVVINLATNALHAIDDGPGHIDVRLDTVLLDAALVKEVPMLLQMHAKHPGRTVRLAVHDDGAGMDEATLNRIFEPFFTTKPVGEGTGLGLSVVHGIVRGHEGVIVADSKPGGGSSFTIYLPAGDAVKDVDSVKTASAVAGATDVPLGEAGAGKRILYLDDENALVYLVERFLQRRGYRVSGFTNQKDALTALRADPAAFDLVLTDYNMPGMSGLDVVREVKAIRANLPVAVASGFLDETLRAGARAAGVQLIFKATELNDFCAVIQQLVADNAAK